MSPEVPLQYDLTGELLDNRTPKQKRLARQANGWQQAEMFSQRELAQFGVKAHPRMSITPQTRVELIREDPRSEEEKEAGRQREIESRTYRMFREQPELYLADGPDQGA